MERIVIVAYRPKPGCGAALRALCQQHVPLLRAAGLATARPAVIAEAADGTIVEVFGWQSPEAIEKAHLEPTVQALWARYAQVCDYVPIGSLPEAGTLFSEFAACAD